MTDPHKLHHQALVVDAHHDILLDVLARRQQGASRVLSGEWAPRLRQGGVDVQVLPVFVQRAYLPEMALRRTLLMIEAFHADLEEDHSQMVAVTTFAEIEKALAANKIAALLGMEGIEGVGSDLALLQTLYRLGVRVISLTWNQRTPLADGVDEQYAGSRLTRLGREAIHHLNRLGVLIDLSHLAERCFYDVLDLSDQPVIASHCNARTVYDHRRNLTDEQIRALARNGGVVGLLLHPAMIDPERPTLARCVDHLVYIVDLVGIKHVGIGSDLQEGLIRSSAALDPIRTVQDCGRVEELPNLTTEMVRRGFAPDEIEQVLGLNFLRVFEKVLA